MIDLFSLRTLRHLCDLCGKNFNHKGRKGFHKGHKGIICSFQGYPLQ